MLPVLPCDIHPSHRCGFELVTRDMQDCCETWLVEARNCSLARQALRCISSETCQFAEGRGGLVLVGGGGAGTETLMKCRLSGVAPRARHKLHLTGRSTSAVMDRMRGVPNAPICWSGSLFA